MRIDTEIFFRPEALGREPGLIRADMFRHCREALAASVTDCAFVPVRSMQLLAVITHDEVVFVDNLNYAVHDGRGGRMIMLAWDLSHSGRRDALDSPVPVEIILFHDCSQALHDRLMSDFLPALQKFAGNESAKRGMAEIIPLKRS